MSRLCSSFAIDSWSCLEDEQEVNAIIYDIIRVYLLILSCNTLEIYKSYILFEADFEFIY